MIRVSLLIGSFLMLMVGVSTGLKCYECNNGPDPGSSAIDEFTVHLKTAMKAFYDEMLKIFSGGTTPATGTDPVTLPPLIPVTEGDKNTKCNEPRSNETAIIYSGTLDCVACGVFEYEKKDNDNEYIHRWCVRETAMTKLITYSSSCTERTVDGNEAKFCTCLTDYCTDGATTIKQTALTLVLPVVLLLLAGRGF